MDYNYEPNPSRGCGSKRKGYYLETGDNMSALGTIPLFTYMLGSGVYTGEDKNLYGDDLPALGMGLYDLPASLLTRYPQVVATPSMQEGIERLRYDKLPKHALFDRVGGDSYSPISFMQEAGTYGFSRRLSPSLLPSAKKMMAEYSAIFAVYFYKLPLFVHKDAAFDVIDLLEPIYEQRPANYSIRATWEHPNFSPYNLPEDYDGEEHWYNLVLKMESYLHYNPKASALWGSVCDEYKTLVDKYGRYTVIPFVGTWYMQVSFAYDTNTDEKEIEQAHKDGLYLIDLGKQDDSD